MEGKLFIFSAPSGSGKTTIIRHLMSLGLGLEFSISATSREPRGEEAEGREYYFINPGEFREKIRKNEFVEWEEVYPGQYYGTLRSEVDRIWNRGRHALFDIDVIGGLNLKRIYGEKALAVFVQPPSLQVLEKRLRERGTDDEASLKKRLEKAGYEMGFATNFDRVLVNDKLEHTLKEAEMLVRSFLEEKG
jgi:guanylate kinase